MLNSENRTQDESLGCEYKTCHSSRMFLVGPRDRLRSWRIRNIKIVLSESHREVDVVPAVFFPG